jgi:hypothetical protein
MARSAEGSIWTEDLEDRGHIFTLKSVLDASAWRMYRASLKAS